MKKLLIYLKDYKKECIIAPSFKMLEALFELFVPLVMTSIIDKGIKCSDKTVVIRNGGLLVLLAVIGLTCALFAQYFAARAAVGFAKEVRRSLFNKITGLSNSVIDSVTTSTLITRMTADINTVQNGVNMVLRLFMRSPFIVFGAMIMAFTINVSAALIFVVVIPLLFLAVFAITLVTIPMYKKIQGKLDILTRHIRENLQGVRVVRAFFAGHKEKEAFVAENDSMYSLSLITARISALLNPLTLIIVNVALLILISRGGTLVDNGTLTNGQVIALVNYMSQILVELVKLANLIITINKSLAGASRICDILSLENDMQDTGTVDMESLHDSSVCVKFSNVSLVYPKAKQPALEEISFDINEGETIGIIGGTGSGKTTLASLLLRFYDATSGQIKLFGTDIKDFSLSSLRKGISIVSQKNQLFTGTLRSNLLLANPEASDERMLEALKNAVADDVLAAKGGSLDFEISEGGANLSGGQKQRISIARALLAEARILVLDDSSSALDYVTDQKLRGNLKRLSSQNKLTVFLIAQRIASVKDADRILVLDDGHMVGFDTHDNLLNSCPVYKEIYLSQQNSEEEAV